MAGDEALIAAAEKRDQSVRAVFDKYDKDQSGFIEECELLVLMDELGLLAKLKSDKTAFLAKTLARHDKNNDERLDYGEFRAFYNDAIDDGIGKKSKGGAATPAQQKRAVIASKQVDAKKSGAHPDFPNVTAAAEDEVTAFSQRLNKQLTPKQQKEWFKVH